jgi:hypothetical protein
MAVLALLAGYIVTGYLLWQLLFSLAFGAPLNEWSTAGKITFWVTLALHLLATVAGSALLARRLRTPVLLTMAGTASSIVIFWVGLWLAMMQDAA